jgi:hypothetical protein
MDQIPRYVACKKDPTLVTVRPPSFNPILEPTTSAVYHEQ